MEKLVTSFYFSEHLSLARSLEAAVPPVLLHTLFPSCLEFGGQRSHCYVRSKNYSNTYLPYLLTAARRCIDKIGKIVGTVRHSPG